MSGKDPAIEIALIRADIEAVQDELKAVRRELKDLLDAWNTATGMVRFVKWLSTLMAAMAVIYLLLAIYFKSIGGYRPLSLNEQNRLASDSAGGVTAES